MVRAIPAAAMLLLGLFLGTESQKEPEILASIAASRAYVGQPLNYQVTIRHLEDAPPPEFAPSEDFDLELLGGAMDQRASDQPGSASPELERVYRYRLIPRKPGPITIPPPRVRANGAVVEGPRRTIAVAPADQQDVAILNVRTDHSTVYPTQEFTLTLTIAVREVPEPYQERDPLDALPDIKRTPPRLRIPWIDGRQIPEGLIPCTPWEDWLAPLRGRQKSGFRINSLGERSVQSLFENRTVTFRSEPRRIVRPDRNGIEKHYWQYEFSRKFLARDVGRYQLGPVTLEGEFATSSDAQQKLLLEDIYASAEPVEIVVQSIPEKGRPDVYVGAIGQFQLDAQLIPKQAKVGDPLRLELRLQGKGSLANTTPPDFSTIPAVSERFRIYQATQSRNPDGVLITYQLRPLQAGNEPFPSIPVGYFDVAKNAYAVLRTPALPLHVLPADRFTSDQIVASATTLKSSDAEPLGQRAGIFANVTNPSAFEDDSTNLRSWMAAAGGLALLYLAALLVTLQLRRRAANPSLARRRSAGRRAWRTLRRARAELASNDPVRSAELASSALVGLVADTFDLHQPGLTRKEILGQLRQSHLPQDLEREVVNVLEACDAAKFSGSFQRFTDLAPNLQNVMTRLIQSLKKEG